MIKRNPYFKTKATSKRIKEVKDLLSDVGMKLYDDKEWEEFQVYPDGYKREGKNTYHTLDRSAENLEDALQTGLDMAKRIKVQKNPRCRTFQVKRRVGKKIIKVRRKVCNPISKLDDLIGKKVELYYDYPFGLNRSSLEIIGILHKGNIHDKYKIEDDLGLIGFSKYDVDRIDGNKIYIEG